MHFNTRASGGCLEACYSHEKLSHTSSRTLCESNLEQWGAVVLPPWVARLHVRFGALLAFSGGWVLSYLAESTEVCLFVGRSFLI